VVENKLLVVVDEYLERDLSLLESDKTNHKENQVSRAGEKIPW